MFFGKQYFKNSKLSRLLKYKYILAKSMESKGNNQVVMETEEAESCCL